MLNQPAVHKGKESKEKTGQKHSKLQTSQAQNNLTLSTHITTRKQMSNLHKKANCKKSAVRLISQQYTKTKKNAGQTKFKITKETKLSKSQSNLNLVTHCTAHKTNKIAKRNKIAACARDHANVYSHTRVHT